MPSLMAKIVLSEFKIRLRIPYTNQSPEQNSYFFSATEERGEEQTRTGENKEEAGRGVK